MKRNRSGGHGTSNASFVSDTLKALFTFTKPDENARILDVGCGKTFYGVALRGYFNKNIYLEGVEKHFYEPFKQVAELVYDKVTETSITDYQFTGKFDTIFMNHILEHIPLEDAVALLKKIITSDFADTILIGLPIPIDQKHEYDDSESPDTHKWSIVDFPFKEFRLYRVKTDYDRVFLLVWSKDEKFLIDKKASLVTSRDSILSRKPEPMVAKL